ncbi:MAG: superoxide dismutase [Candidatus Thorarchaeota archaeon]|jgi:Fe-Mn family superoxide dismutase
MLSVHRPSWDIFDFEPRISATTLDVHINSLHQGYVDKLNKRFQGSEVLSLPPSEVLRSIRSYLDPEDQEFYRNMMGGNVAHTLFWQSISPEVWNPMQSYRQSVLLQDFDIDPEHLRSVLIEEGLARFGSGWVWGVLKGSGQNFDIYSTQNHDTPYMRKQTPIFCIDLWEHAYFLDDFGDRRAWLEVITGCLDFRQIDNIYMGHLQGVNHLDSWILNTE